MSFAEIPHDIALTPAERRWSLAAAISCVTVFGVGIGLAGPLLSLLLEVRGTDATLNGINAASTFIGVIAGPLLARYLIRWLGLRAVVMGCLAADAALFLAMKAIDGLAMWFVLRIALGFAGSTIFTATEAWINATAGDKGRGRIIGIYAASLSVGFGIGPFLLSFTGLQGWLPFLAGAGLNALAAIPMIFVRKLARGFGAGTRSNPLAIFLKAPIIVLAVGLFGLYETAALTLLPVWGVRTGLDARASALTLSAIYFGSIALQIPIGWLSDRVARLTALRLCGAGGLIGAALIPCLSAVASEPGPALFALLFFWGGFASGLYPVALSIVGDRYRDAELLAANAALITSYGIGSLIGPIIGGGAMDLWNPHGLLAVFVGVFAAFLITTLLPDRGRQCVR